MEDREGEDWGGAGEGHGDGDADRNGEDDGDGEDAGGTAAYAAFLAALKK